MKDKTIKIASIQQHQVDEAKQAVIAVCLEIWNDLLNENDLKRYDSMSDKDELLSDYFS